jgi:ADP-ribose pyrophosphatase YjhB (NUDIX family)
MTLERFNIRVYGLLLHDGRLLVSDEIIRGQRITKFPGGGLELGEGPRECLIREVKEEMGLVAMDLRHFYTTDFFQRSAYARHEQLVSIYYTFTVAGIEALSYGTDRFGQGASEMEWFRWLDLGSAREDAVSLPIDQLVLGMLIGQCST